MDMPGWMPKPIRSLNPRHVAAIDPGQGKIQSVLRIKDDRIVFTCVFGSRPVYFELPVGDRKTGEKVAKILRMNRGRNLISISTMELPADKEAA
jgi:hypothetical protein